MLGRKFEQIDALRFFAILGVVCIHWPWIGQGLCRKMDSGIKGVDLFFVISGFLITLGLIRSKNAEHGAGTSLYKFYIRRFLRIFPVYYLTLIALWFFDNHMVADAFWWHIFYVSNFYNIKINGFASAGYLWSLSVEEQFYLVWPFIILFLNKKWLPTAMAISVILSLAVKTYWQFQSAHTWIAYFHPLGALDAFAVGGILSYLYYYHQDKLKAALYNRYVIAAVFAQFFLCLLSLKTNYSFIYFIGIRTFYGIFCAWWIGRAVFGFDGVIGKVLDNKVLKYIGTISYSIYLFHTAVPDMFDWLKYPADRNLRAIIYAIATVSLSSISWYFFESRILKLKSRFE
jgi:peptidoglycan/LPS O-acetylase OafA/YrhL